MLATRKFSVEEKENLWVKFRQGDESVMTDLLEAYLPLVEIIAVKAKHGLPDSLEVGDLISDGVFGLADAIRKFDSSQGNKFETYATSRIWGEIYDKLRDYDPVSRYSRLKFKKLSRTTDLLFEELQREPTAREIADRIEWDYSEVVKTQAAYYNSFSVNIDEYIKDSTHEFFSLEEVMGDDSIGRSDFVLEYSDLVDKLQEALFKLPEQESIIIYLHHYENLPFNKIAALLGLGSSRVSQIYKVALNKLQDAFL